ncbi:MAG: hypothetical protein ABIS47_12680 [Acidimicrobiales bacterium]
MDPEEQDAELARLDPGAITSRARAVYEATGRPALPHTAHWPIFPFETDGLVVRPLDDPVVPEPQRRDETADVCSTCTRGDEAFLWAGERWRISMSPEPRSLPSVTLHPRRHLDLGDLSEEDGAEMGVLLVRIERALASIAGVGRVHVYKWGDGGAHLHVFVVARPHGLMQLRGMYLTTWMDVLPPLPEAQWQAIRRHVGARLT